MIKIKKSNAFVALVVLTMITILFMGYYFTMKPHAMIYNMYTNDSAYVGYLTEEDCRENQGYWFDSSCHQLSERAITSMQFSRKIWLIAPFIVAVGLIFWLFTKFTKQDPQEYY